MLPHHLVVIGASAGGLSPIIELVAGLSADFPAAICVVMHIPAYAPSALPEILGRAGALPASHPADGEAIVPGQIYCAAPDHHLLIEDDHLRVTRGPKENRVRPAVDALFRSAASSAGPGVIGVVLSGLLDDGTSGLWAVEHFGGATVIQSDAEYDSMPRSAAAQVRIDYSVPASELAALLTRLCAAPVAEPVTGPITGAKAASSEAARRVATEIGIALSHHAHRRGVMNFGQVTPQTCPECGGVLVEIREGALTRYRCHTGHAFSGDSLLVGVTEAIEDKLWATLRALEEATMLLENTGKELERSGNTRLAEDYARKAQEMESRSRLIFQNVTLNRSLSAQQLDHEAQGFPGAVT